MGYAGVKIDQTVVLVPSTNGSGATGHRQGREPQSVTRPGYRRSAPSGDRQTAAVG